MGKVISQEMDLVKFFSKKRLKIFSNIYAPPQIITSIFSKNGKKKNKIENLEKKKKDDFVDVKNENEEKIIIVEHLEKKHEPNVELEIDFNFEDVNNELETVTLKNDSKL
jgi:hypothetical protein